MRFHDLISKKDRAELARKKTEILRLHRLPDRFLARALIQLSREACKDLAQVRPSFVVGYDERILKSVIPRLAHALGETGLTEDERDAIQSVPEKGQPLRDHVGICMKNEDLARLAIETSSDALAILSNSFVNGNPITSALDRVAPPSPESDDWVARHMREISRARFGDARCDRWEPEFQDYQRSYSDLSVSYDDIFASPGIAFDTAPDEPGL